MKLKPGVSLGQYRIVSELGRGGMAAVCKAWQPSLERHVAIKVLPQFFADDPTFRERFRREALTIASLNHPGILPIYEFSATGRITYIVGELIGGGTLADRVGDRLPLDEVGRLLRPVAEDLDFAHSRAFSTVM
jgi:eukaryotic-like serine/threonine-protein kinase